jgi:putative DNA primase/helicase
MNPEAHVVKRHASGLWEEIISAHAPKIKPTIQRGRKHGPCDLCGGRDRARCHNDFSETGGIFCNQCGGGADGLAVLMWANGWTFPKALEVVSDHLGLTNTTFPTVHTCKPTPQLKKDWGRERTQCLRTWDEARSGGPRLQQYLECRGLSVDLPETLRLNSSLEYWHGEKSYGKFPCMVTKIIRGGELVGIHRTFLDIDDPGKAPVPEAKLSKKCADTMTGAAIQLFEPHPQKPLALAEGIETALAVHQYSGWPVWSCVNRILLEKVELPECAKSVVICGDKDKSGDGQRSAEKLARRLVGEGREVKIALPPTEIPEGDKSVDWLNFLTQEVAHVR